MGKKINNITELGTALGLAPEDLENIDDAIQQTSLSRLLSVLRAKKGLTQSELASEMGVSQSRISKLEHATNSNISFEDIHSYTSALGYRTALNIFKPRSLASEILQTVKHLTALLNKYQKSARLDENILLGMVEFEQAVTKQVIEIAQELVDSSREKISQAEELESNTVLLVDDIPFETSKADAICECV